MSANCGFFRYPAPTPSGATVSFGPPPNIPRGFTGGRMTKNEFVDRVAAEANLSKKDAGAAVDAVLRSIETALNSGEEVNFTGFGKFHVAERGAREGRNPRTGATMTIAASKVPRFTAGSGLQKAVKYRECGGAGRQPAPGWACRSQAAMTA